MLLFLQQGAWTGFQTDTVPIDHKTPVGNTKKISY
jgi:hypothetical protein